MIIGRTNVNAELHLKNNKLSREKYFVISHLVRDFIIDNAINTLPVCLNSIIKKNKWKIVPYGKLKELNFHAYDNIMKKNLGFAQCINNRYTIFYNEQTSVETQRFTIAHEIGHIVLNHFKVPIENREQEANMFAARLLMPMCILYECKVKSEEEISKLCMVSRVSAQFRFARLEMLKERQKFYTDANELSLKQEFTNFITFYNSNNCLSLNNKQ